MSVEDRTEMLMDMLVVEVVKVVVCRQAAAAESEYLVGDRFGTLEDTMIEG